MRKYKGFILGVITGLMLASLPIFADSYSRAVDAVVNFTNIQVNGKPLQSDNMLIDDKTYVWIRDVANMLDKDIVWDENTNTANIVDKGTASNIAVTVNGQAITDRKIRSFRSLNPTSSKDNVINTLIEKCIFAQKAESYGVEPFDAYVKRSAEAFNNDLLTYSQEIEEYLMKNGFTEQEYIDSSAENDLVNDVIQAMYDNYKEELKLDDSEVRELYNSRKDEYETVTAKHILISDEEKAKSVYAQLKRGGNFDKVMQEETEDPGLATNPDGYTFSRGQMVPEFENAAFTQEIGKLYEPVKSTYGYHIILVTARGTVPYDDVYEELVYELFSNKLKEMVEQWKSESEIIMNAEIINSL